MNKHFDCMLHLAGEQALPIYFGLKQFECRHHYLAVTDKTRNVGEIIASQVGDGSTVELIDLPAYDISVARSSISALFEKHPSSKWAFNLTGGTKPMFVAALEVARSQGAEAFYIETSSKSLTWLLPLERDIQALKKSTDKVSSFISLAGYESNLEFATEMAMAVEDKIEPAEALWRHHAIVQKSYRSLANYTRYPSVPFSVTLSEGEFSAKLEGPKEYIGTLQVGEKSWSIASWIELAQFVVGGWFECLAWKKVQDLKKKGLISDCLFRVSPVTSKEENASMIQEFDVSFTDGYCLTIVECKAGEVRQEHVQKLENLSRRFGGHFGRGVLLFADESKLDINTSRRIKDSNMVCAISWKRVLKDDKCLLSALPGEVLL